MESYIGTGSGTGSEAVPSSWRFRGSGSKAVPDFGGSAVPVPKRFRILAVPGTGSKIGSDFFAVPVPLEPAPEPEPGKH
uniref:PPE-SVP domain-containing protein n=1 Tax=Globodera pallida TaxID=36090 RepID=A0A183BI64_GLOPA